MVKFDYLNDEFQRNEFIMDCERPDYGFKFTAYGNGHVSNSKPLGEDDLFAISSTNRNIQNLVVECKACGEFMRFETNDPTDMDQGVYICPHCGKRIMETTLYSKLDKETDDWNKRYPETAEDYVEDDQAWLEDL